MISGAEKIAADCARRSPDSAPLDAGSIPAISTPWRPGGYPPDPRTPCEPRPGRPQGSRASVVRAFGFAPGLRAKRATGSCPAPTATVPWSASMRPNTPSTTGPAPEPCPLKGCSGSGNGSVGSCTRHLQARNVRKDRVAACAPRHDRAPVARRHGSGMAGNPAPRDAVVMWTDLGSAIAVIRSKSDARRARSAACTSAVISDSPRTGSSFSGKAVVVQRRPQIRQGAAKAIVGVLAGVGLAGERRHGTPMARHGGDERSAGRPAVLRPSPAGCRRCLPWWRALLRQAVQAPVRGDSGPDPDVSDHGHTDSVLQ